MGDVRTQGRILEGLVYCQVTAEVAAQGAIVRDANGHALAYVLFEKEPGGGRRRRWDCWANIAMVRTLSPG